MRHHISYLIILFSFISCSEKLDESNEGNLLAEDKMSDEITAKDVNLQSQPVCEMMELEITNRSDFTKRKDIESPSKFDSLEYNWIGDTLYLNHFFMKIGTCGKFKLVENKKKDVIKFDFQDNNNCELATYFQLQAKILIKNELNNPVFYGKRELNKSANTVYSK